MQSSISTSLSDGLIGSCMNLNVAFFLSPSQLLQCQLGLPVSAYAA